MSSKVVTGLSRLCHGEFGQFKGASLGLLANPAAVGPDLTPAWRMIQQALPGSIKALFGPQHGFFAEKQDNMVESGHGTHPELGVPIYSLYGETRRPTPMMLSGLDALLVDLVDVGCRVYTFFSTLVACLEECAEAGVEVVVLDRPNPIGRRTEGPVLPPELMSFVGAHAIPLSHGLTLGELAKLVVGERNLNVALTVIPCQGWDGGDFAFTGLPWVMPSPNMPTLETARVYPGQVLLEGTTLSEGRGTTRPFEIFGAPGLEPEVVAEALEPGALDGAILRPLNFEPTFHRFAGQVCGGFQIHVTDSATYHPLRASLALLGAINRAQPGLWGLRPPPYEYEHERRPLDLLLGDAQAVDMLVAGAKAAELEARWEDDLAVWHQRRQSNLLYPA
ncbi:MAG: DUF1343 domain-containing protein [Deltaproteobacteria bacterium]|nr:DUF1343 domain-containing protein [Deltaproteobacteria bacterium]